MLPMHDSPRKKDFAPVANRFYSIFRNTPIISLAELLEVEVTLSLGFEFL